MMFCGTSRVGLFKHVNGGKREEVEGKMCVQYKEKVGNIMELESISLMPQHQL